MNETRTVPLAARNAAVRSGARRMLQALVVVGALVGAWMAPGVSRADVPGRVGRIAFMEGDVQSYSETEPEWKVAYLNEPITSRNSIFVGDAGRAEISVGSTTLAMDAGSQVDIQQLDDNTFNANVVRGRVSMRLRRVDPGDQYNVAVPGSAFALLAPGRYRVDALDDASGITVFAGHASVQTDGGPAPIAAGNALRVVANPQNPDGPPQLVAAAPVSVPLDGWVVAREDRFRESVAQRYVSPNMTGYEDLDANGQWASEPDVGPIWYPRTYVRADWAPYRYGRWAYVAPWGYTWIDDAPWGFAPFHYGRWIQVGNRWGWCPGAYVARPVYAPALVGFYGGSGFTASFSIGAGPAVGWYPLAPWERFAPHYAHNATYVNQVNNITVVNAPARFAGRVGWNRERGATLAPRDAFASQRSISQVAIAAPRNVLERAAPVGGGDLPRPNAVPGAVRGGPDGPNGNARPAFRPPREFAQRPANRDGRAVEARTQPGPNGPQGGFDNRGSDPREGEARATERNTLPPGYRRLPETPRPGGVPEGVHAVPPGAAPAAPGDRGVERAEGRPNDRGDERATNRRIEAPRGPNQPNFSREGRPVPQAVAPQPAQQAPAVVPNGPPAVDRLGPRQQAMQRGDGEALERGRRENPNAERSFERPNREFRAPQAPQPAVAPQLQPPPQQPVARPPAFERPQAVERPHVVERPQVMERSPPVERPQAVERPQRIERPAPAQAVAPTPPPAPVAQPAPAPAAQPRQGGPHGDPNDRMRER